MKKFIFFFSLMLCAFIAEAQLQPVTFTRTLNQDTIIDTGTAIVQARVYGGWDSGAFQVVNTKISGTVAGYTLFEGSVDGANYVTLDTLFNTNVTTNTKIFLDTPPRYLWYRFRSVGSGTMRAKTSAVAALKRSK